MISSPSPSVPEGFLAKRKRLRQIAARFDCSTATRGYIVGKLATDPAYEAVFERFGHSDVPIVDIGCGMGLLAHYLRARGSEVPIRGYDFDERKIARARAAAERGGFSEVTFEVGDVSDHPPSHSNLVLLDVLHYLDADSRKLLLERLAAHVRDGGHVLIRGAVREPGWRYQFTLLQEFWTRWSGWIPSPAPVTFPTIDEITRPFEALGCRCQVSPLWGRTPFNSYLITASYSE